MTPEQYSSISGGPPLPPELDPVDPLTVERWLIEASVHARTVAQSTYKRTTTSRGKTTTKSMPNFSKSEQKRWRVSLRWPFVQTQFIYDEDLKFHLDLEVMG